VFSTSRVNLKRSKRSVSYKADQSTSATFHDLTVELAKTQVNLLSLFDVPVVKLLQVLKVQFCNGKECACIWLSVW